MLEVGPTGCLKTTTINFCCLIFQLSEGLNYTVAETCNLPSTYCVCDWVVLSWLRESGEKNLLSLM